MSVPPPVSTVTGPSGEPIPNYMVWAIVATVIGFCLCCPSIITGITAIVFASQVNAKANAGDRDGALKASSNAKTWTLVTAGLAVVGLIINIIWIASGGMAEYQQLIEQLQQAQGG